MVGVKNLPKDNLFESFPETELMARRENIHHLDLILKAHFKIILIFANIFLE